MSSPLVSIIIPLYNREEIVKETLGSVLAQTYPYWECIIVDDISTDNSLATAQEYAIRDSRFKVFQRHREPKGAPTCRNIGLERAEGEYVIFLDSDDLLLPCCLNNRIKYFSDETLDVLISNQKRLENGKQSFYVNIQTHWHPLIRFYSLKPITDIPWVNNSLIIKKEFLVEHCIFWNEDLKYNQDIQFNINLLRCQPQFLWSKDEFDSYWTFNDKVQNIGRSNLNEIDNQIELLNEYRKVLNHLAEIQILYDQVKRQYLAMVISYVIDYSLLRKGYELNMLITFFKEFHVFDDRFLFLMKVMYSKVKKKNRTYIDRFILKRIENFLLRKFQPVIEKGYFLEVR